MYRDNPPVAGLDAPAHWNLGAQRQAQHEAVSLHRVQRYLLPALMARAPGAVERMVEAHAWLVWTAAANPESPTGYFTDLLGILFECLDKAVRAIQDPAAIKAPRARKAATVQSAEQVRAYIANRLAAAPKIHRAEVKRNLLAIPYSTVSRAKKRGKMMTQPQRKLFNDDIAAEGCDMSAAVRDLKHDLDPLQNEVALALSHGESKRSIARRLGIPIRQVSNIVAIIRRLLDEHTP